MDRWQENGLSAEAFAAELGTKPATLKFWKYRLEQEARGKVASANKTRRKAPLEASLLVEVRTSASVTSSSSFVLECLRRATDPKADLVPLAFCE